MRKRITDDEAALDRPARYESLRRASALIAQIPDGKFQRLLYVLGLEFRVLTERLYTLWIHCHGLDDTTHCQTRAA